MTTFGCHPLHLWRSHCFDKPTPFIKVQTAKALKAKVCLPSPIHASLCPSRDTFTSTSKDLNWTSSSCKTWTPSSLTFTFLNTCPNDTSHLYFQNSKVVQRFRANQIKLKHLPFHPYGFKARQVHQANSRPNQGTFMHNSKFLNLNKLKASLS